PHELNDLAEKPEFADKVKAMLALLAQQQKLYDDPAPLTVAEPRPAAWTPPDKDMKQQKKAGRKQKNK
ncbi:MAG: hypothetical protein NTY53_00840, partial [Kiritimatiellaeota bacterium]|nr:hypothetical protein [Kiritimatiellota bacterium]